MKQICYCILMLFCTVKLSAQEVLNGLVLDSQTQTPLIGANLSLKKSKLNQLTNSDGKFSFSKLIFPDTLTVSYIGYDKQKIAVLGPLLNLEIKLFPLKNTLQEVVVSTGYQQIPKERATGSFDVMSEKQLNEQVSTTILDKLEALASGYSVDRAASSGQITIRGLSTLTADRDPLIVVDNFPYEGDLKNLNPNDVESITILKDAAAASIWGARAGNGVIVITTKKGKYNQPVKVDFNSNFTVGSKPDLSYLKPMSSADYLDLEQFLFDKGYYNSQITSSSKPALTPMVELLVKKRAGTITAAQAGAQINLWRQQDVRNDLNQYFYQEAFNQQYALNISGGTTKHSWLFFSGLDHNKNNLDEGYNRINLKFQNNFQLGKKLNWSTGLKYTQSKSTNGKPGFTDLKFKSAPLYPYADLVDDQGNELTVPVAFSQSYVETAGGGKLLDWSYRPAQDYQYEHQNNQLGDLVFNTGLNYQLIPALAVNFNYQYEKQQGDKAFLYDQDSYYARNQINLFTQIPTSGAPVYKVPLGGIFDQGQDNLVSHQIRGQLNLNKNWKNHELNAIAGTEVRSADYASERSRVYGYNPENGSFVNVDYTSTYPRIYNNSNGFILDNQVFLGGTTRFISFYGNAAYSYQQKYTLSLSARSDASNLYGVSTQDKWQPLWSVGLGWDLSMEKFYHSELVPYLKLRSTYGYSGNTVPSLGAVTTIALFGTSPYTQSPYYRFNQYANPDLKWETSAQLNLGLDFRIVKNILSGSIEYYHKRGFDLISIEPVDYTGGIGETIRKNAAEIKGSGWDIQLNSINVNRKFKWQSRLNLSTYKDQIVAYYLSSTQGSTFLNTGNARVSGVKGNAVYGIYSYKSAGLDPQTGQPRGFDPDGNISMNYLKLGGSGTQLSDLVYHGPAMPTCYGSLGNTFSYGNFSLSAAVIFKLGYYFRRETMNYQDFASAGLGNSDYALRWKQPGDEAHTDVAAFSYPFASGLNNFYKYTSPFVEKGDQIRLQYVNLSYALPQSITKAIKLKQVQLYFNASNLGLLWKTNKAGIDPDYSNTFSLLPSKTFSFGFRAGL